jgi:ABC-type multidrug transport system fused ATPase/permease subunit
VYSLFIVIIITILASVLFCYRAILITLVMGKSLKTVHRNLLVHIIRARPSFYDSTPTGGVLSRFTGDLPTLDTKMSLVAYHTFMFYVDMILQVCFVR